MREIEKSYLREEDIDRNTEKIMSLANIYDIAKAQYRKLYAGEQTLTPKAICEEYYLYFNMTKFSYNQWVVAAFLKNDSAVIDLDNTIEPLFQCFIYISSIDGRYPVIYPDSGLSDSFIESLMSCSMDKIERYMPDMIRKIGKYISAGSGFILQSEKDLIWEKKYMMNIRKKK